MKLELARLQLGAQLLQLVQSPGGGIDGDGVVYHPVHCGCGVHRVSEVVAEFGEVNVVGQVRFLK